MGQIITFVTVLFSKPYLAQLHIEMVLASILKWDEQDSEEAIKGIQQGLHDFDTGNFRAFEDFAQEQRPLKI